MRSSARTTTQASRAKPVSRRPTPGRCSPAWPATRERIGLGALVSPVTFRHARHPREGHHDGRRDERRPDRVRARCGLERRRARPARAAFPAIERRADLLEDQLAILLGLWGEPDGWSFEGKHIRSRTPCSTRSRSTSRAAVTPTAAAAADPRRQRRLATVVPHRGALCRRVQPHRPPHPTAAEVRGSSTRRAGRSTVTRRP